jgi:hypothetical protein
MNKEGKVDKQRHNRSQSTTAPSGQTLALCRPNADGDVEIEHHVRNSASS